MDKNAGACLLWFQEICKHLPLWEVHKCCKQQGYYLRAKKFLVSNSFQITKLLTLFYRLVRADIWLFLHGMLSWSRYTNFGLSSTGDTIEQETLFWNSIHAPLSVHNFLRICMSNSTEPWSKSKEWKKGKKLLFLISSYRVSPAQFTDSV